MPKLCDDVVTSEGKDCPDNYVCRCYDVCSEEDDCGMCPAYGCPKYPLVAEPKAGKWSYNFTEDGIWDNDTFDTKEEAFEAGLLASALEDDYETFYTGKLAPITISQNSAIDVDDILERVGEQLDEEYGGDFDHGEQWYDAIKKEDQDTLETMLNATFHEWLQKTNNHPTSLTIVDIDMYSKDANWEPRMLE